jgi:multidrug efflux pump
MDEVGGALIAIALVLSAVFIPAAFIPGISGQFFRQFAVTIASATIISCLCSLTLSPALCALLFKPHQEQAGRGSLLIRPIRAFSRGFNYAFDKLSLGYGQLTGRLLRVAVLVLVVYAGLIGLAGWQFVRAPTGFIPNQDQAYLITVIQLPPGASLARTDTVVRRTAKLLLETPGVAHVVPFAGFDGATFTNAPNAGAIFSALAPFQDRVAQGLSADRIMADMRNRLAVIEDAFIITISPPPVRGIGTAGGFKMMVQDKRGRGLPALEAATQEIVTAANQVPGLVGVFSLFNTRTPKVYADIDRVRAEMLGVSASRVFETLQVYLGSSYVNDFNYLGRTYRVTAQADAPFRDEIRDIVNLKTCNDKGQMVPIGSVAQFRDITGPYRVPRYNLYSAAEIQGSTLPGYSTGYALAAMERLAAERLPDGFGFEWTDLAYQQKLAGNTGLLVFCASIIFVFLVLAIRELELAARGDPDRADVSARRGQWSAAARDGREHPGAGRVRGTRRACRQKRDPDRRVRAPGRGRRQEPVRRCRAGGTHAAPADPDDIFRVHLRRRAAGDRHRRRRRNAPVARHRRLLRHARRYRVRSCLHAGVLRRGARAVRQANGASNCQPSAVSQNRRLVFWMPKRPLREKRS